MAKHTEPRSGKEAFDAYYHSLFGDRFEESLKGALLVAHLPILRYHPPLLEQARALFAEHHLSWNPLDWYPHAIHWPPEIAFGSTMPGVQEGYFYIMSPSSLLAPLALASLLRQQRSSGGPSDETASTHTSLDTPEALRILDACAAPGGKTLALADLMPRAHITANEISQSRLTRLQHALKLYHHAEIPVTRSAAETLFKHHALYDGILLDSPCSSEAHVYASPHHLAQWSRNRVRQMQFRQLALLGGLIHALKPGGVLVYSTCALTPAENEQVVEAFLHKRSQHAELLDINITLPNIGSRGMKDTAESHLLSRVRRIWPDTDNMDMQFIAAFQKK